MNIFVARSLLPSLTGLRNSSGSHAYADVLASLEEISSLSSSQLPVSRNLHIGHSALKATSPPSPPMPTGPVFTTDVMKASAVLQPLTFRRFYDRLGSNARSDVFGTSALAKVKPRQDNNNRARLLSQMVVPGWAFAARQQARSVPIFASCAGLSSVTGWGGITALLLPRKSL